MKRLSLFAAAALAVAVFAGCSHIPFFSRASRKNPNPTPKESSHIATDTEKEFKLRWVDKRAGELISQGKAPDDARAQAIAEFDKEFAATHVAHE